MYEDLVEVLQLKISLWSKVNYFANSSILYLFENSFTLGEFLLCFLVHCSLVCFYIKSFCCIGHFCAFLCLVGSFVWYCNDEFFSQLYQIVPGLAWVVASFLFCMLVCIVQAFFFLEFHYFL